MGLGSDRPVVEIRDLVFAWPAAPALLAIDRLTVGAGESVFLRGPSGSGKSTLLALIGGVLLPSQGHVTVCGTELDRLGAAARDRLRAAKLGVIFQMFNLVPYLSLLDNVLLPCRFSRERRARAAARSGAPEDEANRLLDRLGLAAERRSRRPVTALSVGQQQRVAAARALIGAPALVLADEPTSALDADTRDGFLQLLQEEARSSGAGLLFVSHDSGLADRFDRCLDLPAINRTAPASAKLTG